ncbi:MAG: type IV toxin-antitoxin system AbiEi family antitoxin domain-containing protein [Acidimicrobiales bacterium]
MTREVRRQLDAWARSHHGVLTREAALLIGATPGSLRQMVESGQWQRVHAGVFVPAALRTGPLTDTAAALAAGGPEAAASHGSAAWLLGIAERAPSRPALTVPPQRRPRLAGVDVHRGNVVDRRSAQGLACTSPLRTLLDLAGRSSVAQLDMAVDRCLAKGLVRMRDLRRLGSGAQKYSRGLEPLRASLQRRGYTGAPEPSVLESRLCRLLVAAGVEQPRSEVIWGPEGEYRLDFAYPPKRLAIEVNGYVWHFSPEQQARDHERYNRLIAAGWRVLIYSWQLVMREPERMIAGIAALLAA